MIRLVRVALVVLVISAGACAASEPSAPETASEQPSTASPSAIAENDEQSSGNDTQSAAVDAGTDTQSAAVDAGTDTQSAAVDAGTDNPDNPDDDGPAAEEPDAADPGAAGPSNGEETVTPTSPLLGALGIVEYDEAVRREQRREFQRLIQQCMHERGFEYQIYVESASSSARPVSERIEPRFVWGTQEYADRYGYGVTIGLLDEMDRTRAGRPTKQESQSDIDEAEYFGSLGEAGRNAYDIALNGDSSLLDPSMSNEAVRQALRASGNPGCVLQMFDENPTGNERIFNEFEEAFGNVFGDITERVDADPRVIGAEEAWVRCMQVSNYSYSNMSEPQEAVSELRWELADRVFGLSVPADGIVLDSEELKALTHEEVQEYFRGFIPTLREITPQLQQELDELLAFEIAVASTSVRCAEETVAVERRVRAEVEEQFLAENEGAIIALLERVNG